MGGFGSKVFGSKVSGSTVPVLDLLVQNPEVVAEVSVLEATPKKPLINHYNC